MNHQEFLTKANTVHGNKYDYTKTVYVNAKTYITITCPLHGDFSQQGYAHLRGRGCKHCGIALTQEEFFFKVNTIFKNKYTYLSPYRGQKDQITILCPLHGQFERRALLHLQGVGCGDCSGKRQYSLKYFLREAVEVHGEGVYDYSNSKYSGKNFKLDVRCIMHDTVFPVTPNNHISKKSGCPLCSVSRCGYNRSAYLKRAVKYGNKSKLYILKCSSNKEEFYKIGITMMTVEKRYCTKKSMPYEYETILLLEGEAGKIWDLEKKLHKRFSKFTYKPKISFHGQTECFQGMSENFLKTLDIL